MSKTHTSTAVKQRYKRKVYTVIAASVPKDMAAAFKARCAASGISQAQVIKEAIAAFLSRPPSPPAGKSPGRAGGCVRGDSVPPHDLDRPARGRTP